MPHLGRRAKNDSHSLFGSTNSVCLEFSAQMRLQDQGLASLAASKRILVRPLEIKRCVKNHFHAPWRHAIQLVGSDSPSRCLDRFRDIDRGSCAVNLDEYSVRFVERDEIVENPFVTALAGKIPYGHLSATSARVCPKGGVLVMKVSEGVGSKF